jgi:hypothetical protein
LLLANLTAFIFFVLQARIGGAGPSLVKKLVYASSNDKDVDGTHTWGALTDSVSLPVHR